MGRRDRRKAAQLWTSAPYSITLGNTILSTVLPVLTSRILTVLRRSRSAAHKPQGNNDKATTTVVTRVNIQRHHMGKTTMHDMPKGVWICF